MSVTCIYFDCIDSTSTEAKRYIETSPPLNEPVAIVAREQTQGHGQQKRAWSSPSGNLYMTLVIPYSGDVTPLQAVPLRVSLLICQYIQEATGLYPTIKWPNDILVEGAKIGGILCETGSCSDKTYVFIGIGLNLNVPPSPDTADVQTTCLKLETEKSFDVKTVAEELSGKICKDVLWQPFSKYEEDYKKFAIQPGHLLPVKDTKERTVLEGYQNDGQLLLNVDGNIQTILSASNASKYWFQRNDTSLKWILFDVGNSAVKWKVISGTDLESSGSSGRIRIQTWNDDWQVLGDELQNVCGGFVSSVNHEGLVKLMDSLPTNLPVKTLAKRPIRWKSHYDLAQIGCDRWLLIEAGLKEYTKENETTILISFGTAITVDVIDSSGKHIGGHILPSSFLMKQSLHQGTDQLPFADAQSYDSNSESLYGMNTEDAIANGCNHLLATYLSDLTTRHNHPLNIITCGGGASQYSEYLEARHDSDLLFKGMLIAAKAGA